MTLNPLKALSRPEQVVFITLGATIVSVVSWWRMGIMALCCLCGVSLLKTVCTQRFVNRGISRAQRICLWCMVAYWLLYALSAMVSTNHAAGWTKASIKLYFFALPILLLLGDTSYLTKSRLNALFQLLTAALLIRFAACIVVSAIHWLQGMPFAQVKDWQTDPLGMHHNYLSMYLNTAIAFLYTRMVQVPKEKRRRRIPLLLSMLSVLVVYLFAISSRSGIVTLVLLAMVMLVHMVVFRRWYKTALLVVLLSAGLSAGLYMAMPSMFDRFSALRENRIADDRTITWSGGLKTAQEHWLFGHGSGDYMPRLLATYGEMNYPKAIKNNLNAHNQYIETLLETGLVGLAILLSMFFLPLLFALHKKRRNLPAVLTIVVITSQCFFESMLNRQMGVQFIALIYCLLIISLGPDATCRPSQNGAS